ncbi:MAG: Cytosine/purine/uracil/thiamine/allantoin permease family protein [Ktedonobacterales bacterium]|jgi:NCS1 nucleoside transporter family|nr:MAG: Cytosine/purine/uracil/thiamine/allantoin permease family protein [Ktedonobacterales bacterium]
MATVSTEKPQQAGFEVTGIERVAENDRAHTQLLDTMWLWWSANAVVATVALGAINIFFSLGFWGSFIVIVAFNILGVLPVAYLSTLGPKTGLAQMPLTRFSFGLQGAKLPAIFNALACIGWSAVNATIGASLLVSWSGGKIPEWAALIFLATITTAVSVFGYFIVHRYERIAWIPMLLLFGYVFFVAAPHFDIGSLSASSLATPLAIFVGVASFGGAIFGYAIGWSSYAADYTRRQPVNTPAGKVFLYAFLGVTIPCILLETLGVLLTSIKGGAALAGGAPGPLLTNALGTGTIAGIVIVLLAFSTIANNVPNDYSFALSTQVLGLRIKRWILTIVGAVIYVALALYWFQKNFSQNLDNFLLLIAYWLGAYVTIFLVENWFRKGQYPAEDYETASKLPVGIAAIVSMVVGLGAAVLGMSQQLFVGPLSKALGGADIGFPLAIIASGVLYFILRRWEMSRYKR